MAPTAADDYHQIARHEIAPAVKVEIDDRRSTNAEAGAGERVSHGNIQRVVIRAA